MGNKERLLLSKLYRAGRPPLSRLSVVTVTGNPFPAPEVVQASETRIGLIFYPQSNQTYQVFGQPNQAPPALLLQGGSPHIELWTEFHGTIVNQAWYGSSVSAFSNVTFLEVWPAEAYMDSPMPESWEG